MDRVQTLGEIRALLQSAGMRPNRRLGQNFFVDGNLLKKLVTAAELTEQDTVLEVGGGTGVLTDLLSRRAGRVFVVEIDPRLHDLLLERFADRPQVCVLAGDVMAGKHALADVVVESLRHLPRVKLVANLPYQVATPLLINLLVELPAMGRLCFTVQKEVADRIAGQPNRRDYGPVSIIIQAACRVRTIAQVPPQAFWPRPEVDSRMVCLDRCPLPAVSQPQLRSFAAFVRACFLHRRKTLAYNLRSAGFPDGVEGFAQKARPENLSVAHWVDLFHRLGIGVGGHHGRTDSGD